MLPPIVQKAIIRRGQGKRENIKTLKQFKNKQMTDHDFAEEYQALQPELDVIKAIIEARTSQNLTQKQLAERTGINQADISKLE